jgi:hypothetical protein
VAALLRLRWKAGGNACELAKTQGVFQMSNYHIQAELASERRRALLTEAQTARRVRDARSHRRRSGGSTAGQPPRGWRAGRLVSRRISWRRAPRYTANDGNVA